VTKILLLLQLGGIIFSQPKKEVVFTSLCPQGYSKSYEHILMNV